MSEAKFFDTSNVILESISIFLSQTDFASVHQRVPGGQTDTFFLWRTCPKDLRIRSASKIRMLTDFRLKAWPVEKIISSEYRVYVSPYLSASAVSFLSNR
jgi:hypothetical protein